MALEQILERLCEAVEKNTAALTGKAPAATSAVTTSAPNKAPVKGGAAAKGAEGSVTSDELRVAAAKVMDQHGKPFAKKLIKDVGGADGLQGVKREKFGALMKAFEQALTPADDAEEDDSTDEDEDL